MRLELVLVLIFFSIFPHSRAASDKYKVVMEFILPMERGEASLREIEAALSEDTMVNTKQKSYEASVSRNRRSRGVGVKLKQISCISLRRRKSKTWPQVYEKKIV